MVRPGRYSNVEKLHKRRKKIIMENLSNLQDTIIKDLISTIQKKEEEIFMEGLRLFAEPPIKGEITKGKIKWRGIRIVRQYVGLDSYSWLEQRGKQISHKFHVSATINY